MQRSNQLLRRIATIASLAAAIFAGRPAAQSQQAKGHREAPPATQPAEKPPTLDEYESLVELISELPTWNKSPTLTPEEWRTLARTASALQSLQDGHMALLLVKYVEAHGQNLPKVMDDPDPRTRPLLLLSAMFDLSRPVDSDLSKLQTDRAKRGVQICGGFLYNQISRKQLPTLLQYALPLSWDEDGPQITATRVAREVGQRGGPPRNEYQPWVEFHHFAQFYKHRSSFPPYVNEDGTTWRQLIAERKTESATSRPQ